jgi:hypothetical protein
MGWQLYAIVGSCVLGALVSLYAIFRPRGLGLSRADSDEMIRNYVKRRQAQTLAEQVEQEQIERNARQAELDLRALSEREKSVTEPHVGQTDEEIEAGAQEALSRWEKLNSPIWVSFVALWWACASLGTANAEKLTTTQQLTKALNQCASKVQRQKIENRRTLADAEARCARRVATRDAEIMLLRREVLVLRARPAYRNHTPLVVAVTVTSTVAVLAITVAVVAVTSPQLFRRE